ncbi:1-phosphofructokinase family hexose kinase [Micromonospora sp. LH3U1]|uniref:1-phosphofructokinase family hexose kinase n=1 Tax=Micromonospora sp. LH3U1 TaxID=3018339 RepID=UPI00234BB70A|nr:hexose kinase [Micromonospora sp. LH3U1]WCN83131.1 hexose kinase [Micromonospora sp. LH3U1]
MTAEALPRARGRGDLIVSVALNPALDITYTVPELVPDTSHRVTSVVARAGGKGLNVARVLRQLGAETLVLGLLGGAAGEHIEAELAASGMPAQFTRVDGETRRTVTVLAQGTATVLNEPGPHVTPAQWAAFREAFAERARVARVVVLSGSRPPGVPETAYADLVTIARAGGAEAIVDAEGPALRHALAAAPALAKPNAHEAADLLGRPVRTRDDAVAVAHELVRLGASAGVVSRGADGFVAVSGGTAYSARAPERVSGNPTGAGDALAAVLAYGLVTRAPWRDVLARGAAVSAAAVACRWAGEYDDAVASRLLSRTTVEQLDEHRTNREQEPCRTSPPR